MATVQIKNVPKETHDVLRLRAARANQSLQEYLLSHLMDFAGSPTLEDVLDRAGGRAGGSMSLKDAVSSVRADRDSR